MADDPLIEQTERQAAEAANLFDLRRIIGGVFLVWGVLLVILGLTGSDAEIARAADVNINLWAGLGMGALAALFLVWAFSRPLGEELREAAGSSDAPASHERRRGTGGDDASGRGDGDAGR